MKRWLTARDRLQARCQVAVRAAAVGVRVTVFGRNQVQLAVTDAALGDQCIRETLHRVDATLQDQRFDAFLMIEVRVHAGDCQVVMVMLQPLEPLA
jgi:hypothetical protein